MKYKSIIQVLAEQEHSLLEVTGGAYSLCCHLESYVPKQCFMQQNFFFLQEVSLFSKKASFFLTKESICLLYI